MGRLITIDQYLNALSEKTLDNARQLRRDSYQRRNGMEDLYGVCFSAYGDAETPAKFYISLSPDYVYLQRLAFKFVVKPFTTTIKSATDSSAVIVDNTSLNVDNSQITPNPHKHTTQTHTHNVIGGVGLVHTTSSDWSVWINGVDITDYLCEQQGVTTLFDQGEGIYPSDDLDDDIANFYDILDVASVLIAEGENTKAEKLLSSGFKPVEIKSDAPFGIDAYLYVKYSNMNR